MPLNYNNDTIFISTNVSFKIMTLLNLYIFEKVSHMHLFSVTDLCETIPFFDLTL